MGELRASSRSETVNLGHVEDRPCIVCERERPFNLILQYEWSDIYWLFGAVSKEQYLLLCNICSRGYALETKATAATLEKDPIPFMRRYGGAIFFGSIVLVIVASSF